MKTLYSFLMMLTIWSCCYGQHVLMSDANVPRIGDNVIRQEIPYFSPGVSGENVIWDFSEMESIDEYPIEYFCDTDSVILTAFEPEIMKKYVATTDTLKDIGYETALQYMDYEKPIVSLTYPFAYGNSIRNPFRGKGIYCGTHLLQNRGSVSVDADAYGSICLPDGDTIQNVLRIHIIKSGLVNMNILNDTTVFDPNNLKQEIEERYQWYARGYRYPLSETISTTNYNNMEPVSNLQKAYFCLPDGQRLLKDSLNEDIARNDSAGYKQRSVEENDIIHYTVEVNGSTVTVKYDLDSQASITTLVCNQMGFVFRRNSISQPAGNGYNMNIDCTGLRRGIYIFYLNVNGKVYNEKINLK